jgi:hypothetical protein
MRGPCRLALVAGVVLGLAPVAAYAQAPLLLSPSDPSPGFLPRYAVHTSVEALGERNAQFQWDADVGAGLDVVDYGNGRLNVFFNYEMVLGNELQPFDPRQGNYTLDTLATLRWGGTELGVLFHHVSRHLGDREKDFGIAWNDLGLQVQHTARRGRWLWQLRGAALGTVARGFVDYRGDLGATVGFRRMLSPVAGIIGSGGGHLRLVTGSPLDRGHQTGARAELGVRLEGRAAAVEIVGGAERRVDADPFEFATRQWAFAGLRIISR